MTVRELLARIDSAELTEWFAYDTLEPFGEVRADYRAGIIAAQITNHSFSPPREAAQPSDFCPRFDREPESTEPILLADPQEQSELIDERLYGRAFALQAARGK